MVGIDTGIWETAADGSSHWRSAVKPGTRRDENERASHLAGRTDLHIYIDIDIDNHDAKQRLTKQTDVTCLGAACSFDSFVSFASYNVVAPTSG